MTTLKEFLKDMILFRHSSAILFWFGVIFLIGGIIEITLFIHFNFYPL